MCTLSMPEKNKISFVPWNKRTKKQKAAVVLSFLALFLWMGLIFSLSAQPAGESSELSNGFLDFFLRILPFHVSSFFIRKAAHFTEFMLLCVLFYLATFSCGFKKRPWISFFCAAVYAVSDEVHQLFVQGRACQFRDMLIDMSGALLGVLLCEAVYYVFKKYSDKKVREQHGNH